MAATDPTNFTREQIEALGGVISGNVGKAKVLTSADYNYPANNPDGVALWLLAPGVYQTTTEKVYFNTSDSAQTGSFQYLIGPSNNNTVARIYQPVARQLNATTINTGAKFADNQTLLMQSQIIDNLTSATRNQPLSANQGKVLKDLIDGLVISGAGAPTTSTAGTVGKLYEDTTNGKLYICTDATNPYVWEEVGAGGGGGGSGVIELTSADYNYPTDNPTQIAAWLLPDGIYHSASTAIQWSAYGDSAPSGTFIKTTNSSNMAFVFFYRDNGLNEVILSQAISAAHYTNLSTSAVKQTTGTSTTDVMSQNAVTSMVFADPSTKEKVNIGGSGVGVNGVAIGKGAYGGDNTSGSGTVAIGLSANTYGGTNAVAIGNAARARAEASISIGYNAGHPTTDTQYKGGISLGAYSEAHAVGEMNIGSSETSYGYNSSKYRLLTGLYDPQSDHDAATKGYVDTAVAGAAYDPTISNNTLYL